MDLALVYRAYLALNQASVALERAVEARLRPWNLNVSQGITLLALDQHGSQRMTDLARLLLQHTQTTTDLVDRLERRGLVQRRRHGADRRVVLVEVSDEGRGLIEPVREAIRSVCAEVFPELTDDKLVALAADAKHVRDTAAGIAGLPAAHFAVAEEQLLLNLDKPQGTPAS